MSPFQRSALAGLGLPIALIALAALPCAAQTVIPRDTAPATVRPDTAAPSAPAADTAPVPAPPTVAAAPPPPPVDEVLAAACAMGGGVAEDLLLVVFRPGTEPARQQAMARAVGGTLAGTDGQGAFYLKASGAAAGGINALADRVIRQESVETVAPAECPPAPQPPPTAPADSAAGR